MALIRGRDRKTGAQIFTASMADIVFLLIVFFVLTYKVEVDRTKMQLPDTWIRVKIPEKAAVVSIAPPAEGSIIRVSTGEEMSLPVSTDEEVVTFASTLVAPTKNDIITEETSSRPAMAIDSSTSVKPLWLPLRRRAMRSVHIC